MEVCFQGTGKGLRGLDSVPGHAADLLQHVSRVPLYISSPFL